MLLEYRTKHHYVYVSNNSLADVDANGLLQSVEEAIASEIAFNRRLLEEAKSDFWTMLAFHTLIGGDEIYAREARRIELCGRDHIVNDFVASPLGQAASFLSQMTPQNTLRRVFTGQDLISGEHLSWKERLLEGALAVPAAIAGGYAVTQGIRYGLRELSRIRKAIREAREVRATWSRAVDRARLSKWEPSLPKFVEGGQTRGVHVTNEGTLHTYVSQAPNPDYRPDKYKYTGHVEGQAAITARETYSPEGWLWHNNPGGTCPGCNTNTAYVLGPGGVLHVIPPADAIARARGWIDYPTRYSYKRSRFLPEP